MDQDNRAMSPREFERSLERLGLSKAAAGRFLGISERTIHRYADGDAAVPVATVFLLRWMFDAGVIPKVPPRPRPVVVGHLTPPTA